MSVTGVGPAQLATALERVVPGDHLCLIYKTWDEQLAAVVPFIRLGLERGEQCLCIADENTVAAMLDALRDAGLDVEGASASGALSLATKQETYLKQGCFDPDGMIRFLAEVTESARTAGFSALRVTGETTWALGSDPGVERLIEYETKLNRFFPESGALAICQYDRGRFTPAVIKEVIRTHPRVVFGGAVCRNFYYVPPEERLAPAQPSLEVSRLLGTILAREASETALIKSRNTAHTLAEIGRLISQSLDPEVAAQRIADGVRELLGVQAATVYRLEPGSGDLVSVAVSGDVGSTPGARVVIPRGTGVSGLAVQTGAPVITADVLADSRIVLTEEERTRAASVSYRVVLAVPLLVHERAIGALAVGDRPGRVFEADDVRVLRAFADQAAVALENARRFAESEHQRREAEALADLARTINASLDLDTVLQRVADRAREACGSDMSAIALREADGVAIQVRYWSGARRPRVPLRVEAGTGVGGQVLLTGRPFRTHHYVVDPRVTKDYIEYAQDEGIVADLAVPIRAGDRMEGVLYVQNRSARAFTARDETALSRLADLAATAIRNAQLYAEARDRLRQTETLLAVSQSIGSTLDLTEAMRRVARALGRALEADLVGACLIDADGWALRPLAGYHVPKPVLDRFSRTTIPILGHRFVEEAFRREQPVWSTDPAGDPRVDRALVEPAFWRSLLFVPLLSRGQPIGGIFAAWGREPREPGPEHLRLVQGIGAQAALAMENAGLFAEQARLLKESRRQHQEAVVLEVVARQLTSSLDRDEVLQRIVDEARVLCRCDLAFLAPYDDATDSAMVVAASGALSPTLFTVTIARGRGLGGKVLETGEPATTEDYLHDPRITKHDANAAVQEGMIAQAVVPLRAKGRITGLLAVVNRTPRSFTPGDLAILSRLADQAALALENAQLFAETRARLRETETLLAVTRALALHVPAREAMRQVCRELARAFGADMGGAYVLDAQGHALVPMAGYHVPEDLRETLARTPFPLERFPFLREACASGKPAWTSDYPGDPRFDQDLLAAHRPCSLLFAPTQTREGSVGGVFLVWWSRARTFTPDELRLIEAATALVGQALQRARAEAELETRLTQQAAIAELGRRGLARTDLPALMDEAARLVAQAFGVEYATVLECLPDREALLLRAGVGWKDGLVGQATVPAGRDSQAGYTLSSGEPVVVENLRAEPRFSGPPLLLEHGVVSGLSVIIGGASGPFGVLGAHTTRRRTFTQDDIRFLQSVANLLATAINRVRVEEALWQSEARFRSTFDDSRVGRALQAIDGRYLRVNRALCDLLGYSEPEILAMHWQELTHPDDLAGNIELDARMLAGEVNPYLLEKRYVHKQGHVIWASVSISLLRDTTGAPRYLLAEIEDITLRRLAEESLRHYVERLKTLHAIDQDVIAARSPEAIAQASLRRLRQLVPCQRASVIVFDFEADEAVILAANGVAESRLPAGTRIPLEAFGLPEGFHRGQVRIVEDVSSLSPKPESVRILEGEGIRGYIGLPLLSREALIGGLYLCFNVPGPVVRQYAELAREVADSLAVALQNARLLRDAQAGREQLQALSRRLVEVQEQERRHIARELHDEIGQVLTGLKLTLEMSARAPATAAQPGLAEAGALVSDLIMRVRELSLDLRPAMLDDLGLLPALLWHLERYTAQTGIRVAAKHTGLERRFPPDVETTAYRIVQESLTNVVRHAGVREVRLSAWVSEESLYVQVEDRGRGFEATAAHPSGGLAGMRERAALLGGHLSVESAPGRGTSVTAELPLGHGRPGADPT